MDIKDLKTARLKKEYEDLMRLASRNSKYISVEGFGDPPNRYIITYRCTGLYLVTQTGEIRRSNFHQMEISLPDNYPFSANSPEFHWLTPIYHPNIYPSGLVCVGDLYRWSIDQSLVNFVVAIGELIQYKRFNTHNFVNIEACKWAEQNLHIFPIGNEILAFPDSDDGDIPYSFKIGDFSGTLIVGDSNAVTTTITNTNKGAHSGEIQEVMRIAKEMLSIVSSQ